MDRTTTELTGGIASGISHFLSLPESWYKIFEYIVRAVCYYVLPFSSVCLLLLSMHPRIVVRRKTGVED